MVEIPLPGCRPEPFLSYLKALGVFRLVAQQAEPGVQGAWKADGFAIRGALDPERLVEFFLYQYRPTPIIAPWNKDSFFRKPNPKEVKELGFFLNSEDPRLSLIRQVISSVVEFPGLKPRPPTKKGKKKQEQPMEPTESQGKDEEEDEGDPRLKVTLATACRNHFPDEALPALDAILLLTQDEHAEWKTSMAWALGSGGCDGRMEFTNQYLSLLQQLFDSSNIAQTESWLRGSLFGEMLTGLPEGAGAQYAPANCGGANQGIGFGVEKDRLNPWDYVLCMEGTLLLAGAVARRLGSAASDMASPFAVRVSPVGNTLVSKDADRKVSRTEYWLPLWERWANFSEVQQLFSEARASLSRRAVRTGTDFARAISSLGVDRGVTEFVRYGLLQRRGKSFLALALDRVPVRFNPHSLLLSNLDPIVWKVQHLVAGMKNNVPAVLARAARLLEEAVYQVATRGRQEDCQQVLLALGHLQRYLATTKKTPQPLPPVLGPGWVKAWDDGSMEYRLAVSLAAMTRVEKIGSMACHLLPLDPEFPSKWATGAGQVAWEGRNLSERLIAILRCRMRLAERNNLGSPPLGAQIRAPLEDVLRFLYGVTRDDLLEEYLWGLTLVDWSTVPADVLRPPSYPETLPIPRSWAAFKLLFHPYRIRGDSPPPLEPRIVPMLQAGHLDEALRWTLRRLLVLGWHPKPQDGDPTGMSPRRMAAALLFPVDRLHSLEAAALRKAEESSPTQGESHHV